MDNWWDLLKSFFMAEDATRSTHNAIPSRGFQGNLAYLRERFSNAHDFSVRELQLGGDGKKAAVIYLESLTNPARIAEEVLIPLGSFIGMAERPQAKVRPLLAKQFLSSSNLEETTDLKQAEGLLLDGWTIILMDGLNTILAVGTQSNPGRAVTASETETSIFGPKQAFVEAHTVNLALLRQKLKTPKLKLEEFRLGTKSPTGVMFVYLEGTAPDTFVRGVRERLANIEVEVLIESSYLESLLGISTLSPFPQAIYTERPDKVTANLLEGRVALVVDGSPDVLVLPTAFPDLFQVADDYYQRTLPSLLIRVLRVIAFFLATTLPSLYVVLISFNYEVLPTNLIIPVAIFRSGVPFPPFIELFGMLLIVDILQEGATRLPSKVGQTIGVVGGFVLGQAVIEAGLISPLSLITAALSFIGSFAIPDYRVVGLVRILRYALLLGASLLSGVGVVAVWLAVFIHIASLEVLGVPYLRPIAPLSKKSLGDFILHRKKDE
ncbi:MAG: spore germination protein [Peptococcaceae bacterium]|nr:spore germination protein [Peptococcaceae bacterium]